MTGTLDGNYKISIADGATVILRDVTINGTNDQSYNWAGITCLGDATIILEGTNTVKGFYEDWPGIHVVTDKTLTIQGDGTLNAIFNGYSAGIGGGYNLSCGNISIKGGNIIATAGDASAGVGSGSDASCGDITIIGGNVTATGGDFGAGIGAGFGNGNLSTCGTIHISDGTLNALGGRMAAGIGSGAAAGSSQNPPASTCGTISITGGTVYAEGGPEGNFSFRFSQNTPRAGGAGIGTGSSINIGSRNFGSSNCGPITITSDVYSVTVKKSSGSTTFIGKNNDGSDYPGTCGTISIDPNLHVETDDVNHTRVYTHP